MRYNIKRLYREQQQYQKEIDFLLKACQKEERTGNSTKWSELHSQLNSRRHTKAKVLRYISEEVIVRIEEGRALDLETEE